MKPKRVRPWDAVPPTKALASRAAATAATWSTMNASPAGEVSSKSGARQISSPLVRSDAVRKPWPSARLITVSTSSPAPLVARAHTSSASVSRHVRRGMPGGVRSEQSVSS
eukprot:scaffold79522_cov29-Tisochrysis_lutea.AAC.2